MAQPHAELPRPSSDDGSGPLEVSGVRLRLLLKVTRGTDGALAAKMDSLDQGAMDLAVDEIQFDGRALAFTMKAINGSYSGTLDAEGRRISGTWRQGGGELPLELQRHEGENRAVAASEPEAAVPLRGRSGAL